MHRRAFLSTGAAVTGLATAGCLGVFETEEVATRAPPVLEDRPEGVYVPTHREGMVMADMATVGRYKIALTYSFPHRFWLVTGDRVRQVEVGEDDSVHLMLSVWDRETGTILPSSNTPVAVSLDGESVTERTMWGMLSQNMGVHFGDNVTLTGDGTYDVAVDFGPLPATPLGAFDGALGEAQSVSLSLDFSQDQLEGVAYERLSERAGERDALAPMAMEMLPTGQLPAPADLPGTLLGEGTSSDAVFVATLLEAVPAGIEASGPYLAVSARTPYNRYPIPRMGLTATVDGSAVELSSAVHPGLGYHYGAAVDGLGADSALEIGVDSPPSVARHEGYETAFLEMESVTLG